MTRIETRNVALIMLTADCFCSNCGSELFDQLRALCPEHVSTINAVWEEREVIHQRYLTQQQSFWDNNGPKPDVLTT